MWPMQLKLWLQFGYGDFKIRNIAVAFCNYIYSRKKLFFFTLLFKVYVVKELKGDGKVYTFKGSC